MRRTLFVCCYGASGAAALVYQVVWVRALMLVLGHTAASSSVVLAAFMGGLALGAWAGGRWRLSPSNALTVYAALELVVAATAIALPTALGLFEPLLFWAYADGTTPARFLVARAAICFVLLVVPATAMGATFPVAVSWFITRGDRESPGILYSANTFGAAAGALAAGFWLVPAYGARNSTWIAVALNVLAAGAALWLRRFDVAPTAGPRAMHPPRRVSMRRPAVAAVPAIAWGAAAVSGFAALVLEVAWARLLAVIIGPTTYAFALMAASFIVGIAIGSTVGVRATRASRWHAAWLCSVLLVAAAGTLLAAWFAALEAPAIIGRAVGELSGFHALLLREALVLGLVLTASSTVFGMIFTLSLAAASPGIDTAARDSSLVYSANAVGAVAGSLAAGFVLLPRFGLAITFVYTSRLLIAAAVSCAVVLIYRQKGRGAQLAAIAATGAVMFALTFGLPPWDRGMLAGGLYKYARDIDAEGLYAALQAGQLEYYKEGTAGTVSVKKLGGTRSLAIDGKVDASNGADMLTQRLLGVLPTLIHPNPRNALVIGLGSGVTADAVMATGPVESLDIVEISPEVVEAAALFETENRGVLSRAGVRLLMEDGRTHLQLTPRRYDVIVSEPSNPWMAGVASLFTREFFDAVRRRLAADGIFCQWAHTYEIDAADLRSIVGTFASVFPDATLWLVGDGDLLLIGTRNEGIERRLEAVAGHAPRERVSALLADVGVAPASAPFFLFSLYAGGSAELALYSRSAPTQSDDRMSLEFTAARAMYARPEGNASALRALAGGMRKPGPIAAALEAAGPVDWINRGSAGLRADAFEMAHESFRRAIALDSRSYAAFRGSVTAAAAAGRAAEEIEWLRERATEQPQNAAVRTALSYILAGTADLQEALAAALEASRLSPDDPEPLEQAASVLADLGDPGLTEAAATLVRRFPMREEGHFYRSTVLFMQNHHDEAEAAIRTALDLNPRHARARNLQGLICAAKGKLACAIASFEASLKLDPRDPAVYVNLGTVHLERGDVDAAAALFREAAALDPRSEMAREALRKIAPVSRSPR